MRRGKVRMPHELLLALLRLSPALRIAHFEWDFEYNAFWVHVREGDLPDVPEAAEDPILELEEGEAGRMLILRPQRRG